MNRLYYYLAITIIVLFPGGISAQDNTLDYETLKSQLTEISLPLVNITVDLATVSRETYVPASIELADPLTRTNGDFVTTYNCKIKYRGTSSYWMNKKSFGIKLLDDEGERLDANILGIRKDDAWILDAMAIDRIRMRNRVNFDIWNAMSQTPYDTKYDNRNGTLGHFVEVFINGQYQGLYCMTDKINRKLLGLDKVKEDNDGNPIIKGVLYKCNTWGSAAYFGGYSDEPMTGETWNGWELQYPDDYPCEEAYMPLKEFIDYCMTTDEQFVEQFDDRLYMQNVIDYHVFVLSQGLRDNTMKNTFLSIVNTKSGGVNRALITPWDLDCSLGGKWDGTHSPAPIAHNFVLQVYPYRRLWENNGNGYADEVADKWRQLRLSTLSDDAVYARLDAYANMLIESGAWEREYNKWNGDPVELQENLFDELDYVKEWYTNNANNLESVIFLGCGGINDLFNDTEFSSDEDSPVYNIMGQKVSGDYRGFVIKNHRKYILR